MATTKWAAACAAALMFLTAALAAEDAGRDGWAPATSPPAAPYPGGLGAAAPTVDYASLESGRRRVHGTQGGQSSGSKPSEGYNKITKYHYYPHNQHIYLLPECAIQQVCNAVYVRLNHTQPLCACPARSKDPCSASLNSDDQHSMELTTDIKKKPLTMVKTCELTSEMRECRAPRDWSLLALQNVRTGKSHYLVICRCPKGSVLEGPMTHDQPTYASVPGIRVYGMMCVRSTYRKTPSIPTRGRSSRPMRLRRTPMPLFAENSWHYAHSSQDFDSFHDTATPFPWETAHLMAEKMQLE
ncbi:uncharacterized protein LOC124166890 [Ischnura elegans]|uniref:uncharacterized protein LOC124166890 n=1 Tax=Ischnura elegans TaxID=197161 RepID=UPI001ED880CD|nr:uncharacterized protein LOC124166890 [Ischnura elegans]